MAKYYCVLFDADNTLLNFDAADSKALAETLVNYGIEPDAETVQTYRTINSELWRQLEKGQLKREKLMAERFTRFLKAIDAAGDGAEMNRFYLEQLSTHPDLMGPEVLRGGNAGRCDQRLPEGADPPSGRERCAELYGGRVRLREDGQRKAQPQNF